MLSKVINFLKEVNVELKKVSWPDRHELLGSATIVVITVCILAIFIGFCDLVFSKAIQLVIR